MKTRGKFSNELKSIVSKYVESSWIDCLHHRYYTQTYACIQCEWMQLCTDQQMPYRRSDSLSLSCMIRTKHLVVDAPR